VNGLRIRIATLFGIGRFPIASGTVGSAATIPLALLLAWCGPWVYGVSTGVIVVLAIWSAQAAESHFALKDPHEVVIDEVAGQLVTLFLVPVTIGWYAAGFLLFRLFDIVKPPPARQLERLPGGAGIVLDDLAAGLYANLLIHAVRTFVPWGAGS
jgi:phosphatidylglycerophosphatase A